MNRLVFSILSLIIACTFGADIAMAQAPAAKSSISQSHYTAWTPIKESEIARKKRVWEDIKATDKKNGAFAIEGRNNALINVIATHVKSGKLTAYSAVDGRFTTKLAVEDFAKIMATPQLITGYQIKEDSLQLKTGEIVVRIIGLAPLTDVTAADGTTGTQPLFWIYYPDARQYFAESPIGSASWDDVFEQRIFAAKVVKTKVW